MPRTLALPGPAVPTADGITLASWDLGGDGPPLLFLHATGFHGRCWAPLAAELAGSFHCWGLDQRGHGASDAAPGGDYGWDRFSDDVVRAIATLGLERPLVVGHSLGGGVALLTEAQRPGTFAGIWGFEPIVLGPSLPGGPPAIPPNANDNHMAYLARRRRSVFASRAAALHNYAGKPPFATFRADALAAYVDGGFDELSDGTVTLACDTESEARTFEAAAPAAVYEALQRSAVPTYLACGSVEPVIGPVQLEAVAQRLGGATIEVFEHLGHLGPYEDPGRVARAIDGAFRPG